MLLTFVENISTDHGAYVAGQTYDVLDRDAESWVRVGYARLTDGAAISDSFADIITQMRRQRRGPVIDPAKLEAGMLARLDIGAGETALFMPFLGEVGWLVMWHMRLVNFSRASRKIVCCRRGQECLFPSASEFFYDWQDPLKDAERAGTDRVVRQWPEIAAKFPGAVPVLAGGLSMDEELIPLRPGERIPVTPAVRRGLRVDVCIGTRRRKFLPAKNWQHWPRVAEALRGAGLTFAVIGSRESSYALDGMAGMSDEMGGWDAAVELLSNCRLFIGTDSGGAHLASVVGKCPLVVQQVPDPCSGTTRCFIGRMRQTTTHGVEWLGPGEWDSPDTMIERALEAGKWKSKSTACNESIETEQATECAAFKG